MKINQTANDNGINIINNDGLVVVNKSKNNKDELVNATVKQVGNYIVQTVICSQRFELKNSNI